MVTPTTNTTTTNSVLTNSANDERLNISDDDSRYNIKSDRHDGDLYVRPSWTDAAVALAQLDKGKADGGRTSLLLRAWLQQHLFVLGCFLQQHAGKVLFVAVLALATFCVALKSAAVHTKVHQLWIQEGGRLERELTYTRTALGDSDSSTQQLVIQTPRVKDNQEDDQASLLHAGALLTHLDALRAATSVTVHMYDITWRLKDMCYTPSVPNFDTQYIDHIFENIVPCSLITPLDCFWEGSKLLAPDYPVHIPKLGNNAQTLQWTSLNPQKLVRDIRETIHLHSSFPFSTLEAYMKRAGITTGYTEKPCLDPTDPLCPETAPNKKSRKVPDIGAELTGGCYGIAAKYMHWPEELLVGGAERNKTRHVTRARALQTVVQLMNERELYESFSGTYKVHHISWSQEKAAQVLDAWQRKFSEEIRRFVRNESNGPYDIYAFSTTTLDDILGRFSDVDILKMAAGYACMLVYAGLSLLRRNDSVRSQAGIGIAGVVLVSVTVAAGLGFCALLGIAFNAGTLQIIPFLALGLGVNDLFLLTHTYAEQNCDEGAAGPDGVEVPRAHQTGAVLRRAGLSVLLASLSNVCAFFCAAVLIPIPALRGFALQAAILLLFNLAAMLLVYPAMVSLDLRRRRSGRSDLFCCCAPPDQTFRANHHISNSQNSAGTQKSMKKNYSAKKFNEDKHVTSSLVEGQTGVRRVENTTNIKANFQDPENMSLMGCAEPDCWSFSLTRLASRHYGPFLMKPSMKVLTMLALAGVLSASLWGAMKVADGLDLTDIVPQNTDEHKFLSAQGRYFGFYNMFAVTQGDFEYPTNQRLLNEYHEAFVRIPSIIKNDNGGLPEFWLSLFRDWLRGLQKAFDRDYEQHCINQERWFSNASDEAILAYKLLVQTGHVDNPIDKSLITQVRLVDGDGIINPKAFYNYLSAWASNDPLAYGASQANLRPQPREWFHSAADYELKIPKSAPLTYAQLPFYLRGLNDTVHIKELIGQVRELCGRFEKRGLPNFPSGIPFLFWEQYLGLRPSLALALLCALAAVFVVVSILLLNLWAAFLVVLTLCMMILQLLGSMSLLGIKLSAIPAVLLIVAVGMGVHFTVHLCLSFITAIGNRERRARLALEHVFAPVLHGALTTLVAVIMLGTSEFDFIVRYFFYVLLCLIGIGLTTGLIFFPVLLSLIGPAPELTPLEYPDRISTPSPEPSPARVRKSRHLSMRKPSTRASKTTNNRLHAEPSLTTISEEPQSWQSSQSMQSIVVQPEVVVETTYNTNDNSSSGRSSPNTQAVTKVTATANIKVEVHAPISHSRRHYHRESRDSGAESDGSRHS